MIGLAFLAIALVWLALSALLAAKLPKWFGVAKPEWRWSISAALFLLFLIGPFVDHAVGMKQFERLCEERAVMQVGPTATRVVRAKRLDLPTTALEGYWIEIRASSVVYLDADTGQEFLRYDILNTNGGRIAGFAMLGGSYQCTPKDYTPAKRLNIDKLVEQGTQK